MLSLEDNNSSRTPSQPKKKSGIFGEKMLSHLFDSKKLVFLEASLTSESYSTKSRPTAASLTSATISRNGSTAHGKKQLGRAHPVQGILNTPQLGFIQLLGPIPLPVNLARGQRVKFNWYVFTRNLSEKKGKNEVGRSLPVHSLSYPPCANSILTLGNPNDNKTVPLVRIHSACHTGDILGSMRCDCGPQLREALGKIADHGCGAVVYISSHEGRGIGLWNKALAYMLQDEGFDTFEANQLLGYPADCRDYGDSSIALRHILGKDRRKIKLLSNNPQKKVELERNGFEVIEMIPLIAGVNESNIRYLAAKARRGHIIGPFRVEESHTEKSLQTKN